MTESTSITFTRHDGEAATALLDDVLVKIYVDTHADVSDKTFYSEERAAERIRGYLRSPGFEIVIAYADGQPIGQAFGYALPKTSRWWTGLTGDELPDGFTTETGSRTFAFNELMVLPDWQGRHIAHALHDELLRGRAEERATILVREDNAPARTAYFRWGWRKIGKLQPFPDSPHFDALILPLPIETTSGP
jgi:GNAT superfamily N-acetyltransferase